MGLLENLKWRYATKKFDATKKVSEKDIEFLKQAISLTATSYGLEPYQVLIIENQSLKDQLKAASWGQSQVSDASHLFVFCNNTQISEDLIDAYMTRKSKDQGIDVENLQGYGDFMKKTLLALPEDEATHWTRRQSYIAGGNLMAACAERQIDSCPMEGFEADKYNDILKLTEEQLSACLVVPVGYRSKEDSNQHMPKTRKSLEQMFRHL